MRIALAEFVGAFNVAAPMDVPMHGIGTAPPWLSDTRLAWLDSGQARPVRHSGWGMRQPEPITRRLLNIREVAKYTGLAVPTLYTMVSQRRIPYVKVGRLTKFDLRLLDEWIANHTVMPMPQK